MIIVIIFCGNALRSIEIRTLLLFSGHRNALAILFLFYRFYTLYLFNNPLYEKLPTYSSYYSFFCFSVL
jgi:hypothetical protein